MKKIGWGRETVHQGGVALIAAMFAGYALPGLRLADIFEDWEGVQRASCLHCGGVFAVQAWEEQGKCPDPACDGGYLDAIPEP